MRITTDVHEWGGGPVRRLLIISFSNITKDARVLKQVREFSADWEISTCGYGPKPEGATHHFEIPSNVLHWAYNRKRIVLRQYQRAYWTNGAVAAANGLLSGGTWDVVLANDFDTVPLALSLRPTCGVHADLHEYAPREKEELLHWRMFLAPFRRWICRTYLPRCASVTTVGQGLAREYEREFGVRAGVVMNAAPYAELDARPVGGSIRLVHSGAALRNRKLEVMLEAVHESRADVTFDLYLMDNDPGYLSELRARFEGDPRIAFHEPVPYDRLIRLLNRYDVGIYVLAPVSFNHLHALPNKLFDFVQARLGIIIGPSPEMAGVVNAHALGAVTSGFESDDLAQVLETLDPGTVEAWKRSSAGAAAALADGPQNARWREAIDLLVEPARRGDGTQGDASRGQV